MKENSRFYSFIKLGLWLIFIIAIVLIVKLSS